MYGYTNPLGICGIYILCTDILTLGNMWDIHTMYGYTNPLGICGIYILSTDILTLGNMWDTHAMYGYTNTWEYVGYTYYVRIY